jgi:D-lactate dehydrogenase
MLKILFTDIQNDWEMDEFRKKLGSSYTIETVSSLEKVPAQIKDIDILSVFINDKLNKNRLQQFPRLKMIATRTTGYDHIDLDYARSAGILVCNVPAYGDNTVAEHTFALILSLSRNLRKAYLKNLAGDYSLNGLTGFDLKGRTIGIIGTGKIGLRVIQIARGFSMNVIAADPFPNALLADVLQYKYVPVPELLARSDIISLHAPYSKQTHHLINMGTIKYIEKRPLLINTSRGGLIETEALIKALDSEIISGAGIDVIEGEELLFNLEDQRMAKACDCEKHFQLINTLNILKRDNVVFTPHIAFNSKEAIMRIVDTTIDNIAAFSSGQPINVVAK